MKIGRGVSELWGVENRPLPLTWPMAYTTACTTVQAVIYSSRILKPEWADRAHLSDFQIMAKYLLHYIQSFSFSYLGAQLWLSW